jgi:ubiquinone/menaquinone biosynthesis C-methylase UbiE
MKNKNFDPFLKNQIQQNNKNWWESNPMTYDWNGKRNIKENSIEWFNNIDEEFFTISQEFSHEINSFPFSNLIDFNSLKGKKVLEIGCGMGSHAALFASCGIDYTGIDITKYAVETTNKRLQLFGLNNTAIAMQMDAENMDFQDNTFDFVWSWGVIHHSSNTEKIVEEIYRVLNNDGKVKVMIYNKNSTRYYIHGLYQGIFKLKFFKYPSLYAVNMTFTDGYFARHFTHNSSKILFHKFSNINTSIMDAGIPSIIFGWSKLTYLFPYLFNKINKYINRKWGWFLIVDANK